MTTFQDQLDKFLAEYYFTVCDPALGQSKIIEARLKAKAAIIAACLEALPGKITKCSDACSYGEKCRLVRSHNMLIDQATTNLTREGGLETPEEAQNV